jgi:protein gp37
MGANTAIEWAHHTFNPWVGCTKVSPACDNCYAEAWAKRTGRPDLWQGARRLTSNSNWYQPIKWNREARKQGIRQRVFCASLADVFDNQVPDQWRRMLFAMIAETPNLDWLLLTKRPQNMRKMLEIADGDVLPAWGDGWPNVWLGTTVENQALADRRIHHLLAVPAAKHFLSCEPLVGPLDLTDITWPADRPTFPKTDDISDGRSALHMIEGTRIDWVIAGGESGPKACPMHPDWARGLRDQCVQAGVAFFFKQWGEWAPADPDMPSEMQESEEIVGRLDWPMHRVGKKAAGRLLDGREWNEVPV